MNKEVSITNLFSSSAEELRTALTLLASRAVRVDRLISHRLPGALCWEAALVRERAALKVYFQIVGE